MPNQQLTERDKAVILLCSTVGLDPGAGVKPFGPVGWHSLRSYVEAAGLEGPEALMGMGADAATGALGVTPEIGARTAKLLERAGRFTLDLERIGGWGVWTLTEYDAAYPELLSARLGDSAPPLMFGSGDPKLLQADGVAVVGSRRPDGPAMDFARSFGARAADLGLAVVSGAARGVDEVAMLAALESGGVAIGVVADSLERLVRRKTWRDRLLGGELVLLSEHHPSRRFDVGWAMQRNRVVYCLSRAAVVVASDAGRGGTWEGATKNAKAGWVPLFVRGGSAAPAGNRRLLADFGTRELPDDGARAAEEVGALVRGGGATAAVAVAEAEGAKRQSESRPQEELPIESSSARWPSAGGEVSGSAVSADGRAGRQAAPNDFFPRVSGFLADVAPKAQKVVAVAEGMGVPQKQASVWLRRAVDEGLLTRTSKGYTPAAALPPVCAEALGSASAIAEAGIAAVGRLGVDLSSQQVAIDRVVSEYNVEPVLARQWLVAAAEAVSRPLFTLDDDHAGSLSHESSRQA